MTLLETTTHPPRPSLPPRSSAYGVTPDHIQARGYQLPDVVFLRIRDLFPDAPEVIWPPPNAGLVRDATIKSLENVDMSYIKPEHSVNILASHHGFTLLGGQPYAEMLKTIRDVIEKRTGTSNIRLRAGVGLRFRETEEYIRGHKLDEYFGRGKAIGVAPIDQGIPIETEIGTLYGIKSCYDADWIVHAHNSDVREVHFHRHVDRAVKPFGMSYARIETRSTYHHNLGPRGANFVARAIFNSPFVKNKWAFACFLLPTPAGIVGVDADRDLYALDDRVTRLNLRTYGKVVSLLGKIDNAIAVLDFACPIPYVFSAGVIFANFCCTNTDPFDLETPLPPYTWYTEAYYGEDEKPLLPETPLPNPGIKAVVLNYAWIGYPSVFWAKHFPIIVVGKWHKDLFDQDPQNTEFMKHVKAVTPDLNSAMKLAREIAGTDNVIVFDGAAEGLNVSKPLAELLLKEASDVSETVDRELLPKWLKQRGITP